MRPRPLPLPVALPLFIDFRLVSLAWQPQRGGQLCETSTPTVLARIGQRIAVTSVNFSYRRPCPAQPDSLPTQSPPETIRLQLPSTLCGPPRTVGHIIASLSISQSALIIGEVPGNVPVHRSCIQAATETAAVGHTTPADAHPRRHVRSIRISCLPHHLCVPIFPNPGTHALPTQIIAPPPAIIPDDVRLFSLAQVR